ncbi:MAG: hypothetical protein LBC42_03795, partial [Puniceicoccales bacterium]|nr:hypothetical protein [Puniceicoccales bacterium]
HSFLQWLWNVQNRQSGSRDCHSRPIAKFKKIAREEALDAKFQEFCNGSSNPPQKPQKIVSDANVDPRSNFPTSTSMRTIAGYEKNLAE